MKISLSDVLNENNREKFQEIATHVSDVYALGDYYRLDRKIKELKSMLIYAPDSRTLLCWKEGVLLLEAVKLRLGELHIKEMREIVHNGRTKQQN